MERKAVSGITLTLLLTSILTMAFGVSPVLADLSIHNIDTSEDFATIQEAIDDPDTLDKHTILVDSGTYYEHVVVDKSISLVGENRDTTIIDGNKTGDVIEVKADNVTINGFTIQNGGRNGSGLGRGIWIWNSNSVNVTDNIVSHNKYGIWLYTSNYSIIVGNVITSNNGTGVFWWKNNGTIILHNTISDNAFDGVFMRYVTYSIVRENTITANNQSGIGLDDSSGNIIIKNTLSNNELDGIYSLGSNGNIISGNHIKANDWSGIFLDVAFNNNISGNSLTNNEHGIYLYESSNNTVYHNNFINNTQQIYDDSWDSPDVSPSINIWDDDYPSGGNYWSDYRDRYPNAVELDDSGIWDTRYAIDENNQDNYPLMNLWGVPPPTPSYTLTIHSSPTGVTFTVDAVSRITPWSGTYSEGTSVSLVMPETHEGYVWSHWLEDGDTNRIKTATLYTNITLTAVFTPDTMPPTISILFPQNKTYTENNVPLFFTVSESTSWIGYSLDGAVNVTITENTTLTNLLDGTHHVVVFANDTAGDMGSSDTIYFTVQTSAMDTFPPTVLILSPENKTYATTDIPLAVIVDETVLWMAYSLDSQANVTISGTTTLSGLSDGSHSLIVHATDTVRNTGASEIIYFTIESKKEEAFPTWIVAPIVIIGVVGAALLVYYAKVKKTTEKVK